MHRFAAKQLSAVSSSRGVSLLWKPVQNGKRRKKAEGSAFLKRTARFAPLSKARRDRAVASRRLCFLETAPFLHGRLSRLPVSMSAHEKVSANDEIKVARKARSARLDGLYGGEEDSPSNQRFQEYPRNRNHGYRAERPAIGCATICMQARNGS